jgi:hypothetical protein
MASGFARLLHPVLCDEITQMLVDLVSGGSCRRVIGIDQGHRVAAMWSNAGSGDVSSRMRSRESADFSALVMDDEHFHGQGSFLGR